MKWQMEYNTFQSTAGWLETFSGATWNALVSNDHSTPKGIQYGLIVAGSVVTLDGLRRIGGAVRASLEKGEKIPRQDDPIRPVYVGADDIDRLERVAVLHSEYEHPRLSAVSEELAIKIGNLGIESTTRSEQVTLMELDREQQHVLLEARNARKYNHVTVRPLVIT